MASSVKTQYLQRLSEARNSLQMGESGLNTNKRLNSSDIVLNRMMAKGKNKSGLSDWLLTQFPLSKLYFLGFNYREDMLESLLRLKNDVDTKRTSNSAFISALYR